MTKKRRVILDTFCLCYELTGVKTYTNELVSSIEEGRSTENDYLYTVSLENTRKLAFLSNWRNGPKRYLFHCVFHLWKQVVLPIVIFLRGADVVICPDFIAPVLSFRVLKIVVIHDAFLWQSPKHYGTIWRKWYLLMIKAGLSGNCTIITTSRYSKRSLIPFIPYQKTIHVVYQSINHHTPLHRELSTIDGHCILHVGLIEERKNLETLISAFAKFLSEVESGYRLIVAGQSESKEYLEKLTNQVNLLGVEKQVHFTGYVSKEKLENLYKNAFMYVFPSLNEGFGIPLLEAMKNKVPVIISDGGALLEISGGAALAFKTMSSNHLKNQMLTLAKNSELRNELIDLGTMRVQEFSRRNFLEKVESIIAQSLKKN